LNTGSNTGIKLKPAFCYFFTATGAIHVLATASISSVLLRPVHGQGKPAGSGLRINKSCLIVKHLTHGALVVIGLLKGDIYMIKKKQLRLANKGGSAIQTAQGGGPGKQSKFERRKIA
jgi:hypothetical protein